MTTPTPTSNPGVPFHPPGAGGLDLGSLQNLANAFFQALPGDAPSAPAWQSASPARAGPATVPSVSAFPGVANAPAQYDAPRSIASLPSAPEGAPARSHGRAQGVPEAYAAALPAGVWSPRIGASSSPAVPQPDSGAAFYFLDAPASAAASAPAATESDPLHGLARLGLGLDVVTALPFSLPGQEALPGLFGPARHGETGVTSGIPTSTSFPPSPSGPSFAFLEENAAAHRPSLGQSAAGGAALGSAGMLDVHGVRKDFPILSERVNGKPLIWFDNAATTQKPQAVIDRLSRFYASENSNIHRAAHAMAARATDAYEGARRKVADFLGASGPDEIIFVRGATEAINLVARTYGRQEIGEGDEILVSQLEHHANIVPWQMLAENKKARIKVIPVDDDGQIRMDEYRRLLGPRTKMVAIAHVSNALGTVTPVAEIIAMAHAAGAKVLVDGAQAVSHMRTDVRAIDADFYVFSGHKVFGPTGIGVVYGKKAILDRMPPWQGGGNMIADVTFEQTAYQEAPARFEAGTGSIADAVGLGAAIDYVQGIGMERIAQYEHFLLEYATARLRIIPGVRLVGTAGEKASVLSFVLKGYKTEEVGEALNREGIAVRSGHHCAQPILRRMGLEATVRPSLAFYNTCEEVDAFLSVIRRLSGGKR
jgi:cysteine desulfurase/selenocysteine lyase